MVKCIELDQLKDKELKERVLYTKRRLRKDFSKSRQELRELYIYDTYPQIHKKSRKALAELKNSNRDDVLEKFCECRYERTALNHAEMAIEGRVEE